MNRTRPVLALLSAGGALGLLTMAAVTGGTRIHALDKPHAVGLSAELDEVKGCMSKQLHHLVPDGSSIVLAPMLDRYKQRLTEWAAPTIRVVPTQDKADYVLRLRRIGPSDVCQGLVLRVHRA
jgi:hypothetical protein